MSSTIDVKSFVVTLDCPDALALATFYANLLGWRVDYDEEEPEWVDVFPPEGVPQHFSISCQQIDHYRPPEWPVGEVPQQLHFDLYVDSVEQSAIVAESVGARRHEYQPSEDGNFVVFVDPVGHLFCLCAT